MSTPDEGAAPNPMGLDTALRLVELGAPMPDAVLRALAEAGAPARVRDGWADLPLPEDVAAEMSRQMAGSDTAARRESLMDAACRALDAVGTLREKGVTRAALGSVTPQCVNDCPTCCQPRSLGD